MTGRRTGCVYRFPVQAAWWPPGRLVVLPGHPERKTWYRNVASRPTMRVLLAGQWVPAEGSLLRESDAAWASARAAYAQRFPSVRAVGNPLVVLTVSRTTAVVRSPDSTTSSSVLRSGT